MDIYKTNVLRDELLHCDNLEDLKKEILPKLQQQRVAWQWKMKQIMRENQYSGREMAQLCEVSVTSVRKWCKGSLPQSREMFIRIGFAAHYDIEQMNRFLQRYGRYPQLYAKSLEDSVCIFILSSKTLPHTYYYYRKLLESMQTDISGVEPDVQVNYSTVEMEEHIINIRDEETMQRFVQEHAGEYRRAYDKLYDYIQEFLQLNRVSRVDEKQMSIQELADQQNWSSSMRHCISEIRSRRWFPMRRKLISLGVHLNMDLEKINHMLNLAQMETLCTKNPEEAVLIFALEDARLNDSICCDGMDVLCDYVKSIFIQLDMEGVEYILDDL
ncbi:MAG: hypothetical protein IJN54_16985 [Lachnospiraceae bacterium]|nr:hypothetical protein [Lachnospiraceae bacterium]